MRARHAAAASLVAVALAGFAHQPHPSPPLERAVSMAAPVGREAPPDLHDRVFLGVASRSATAPRPHPQPRCQPAPTVPASVPQRLVEGMTALLRRIGGCESSGHPDGPLLWTKWNSRGSGANGAFQDMGPTWRGWQARFARPYMDGSRPTYANAADAPPWLQVQVNQAALDAGGTGPWVSSRGCWG